MPLAEFNPHKCDWFRISRGSTSEFYPVQLSPFDAGMDRVTAFEFSKLKVFNDILATQRLMARDQGYQRHGGVGKFWAGAALAYLGRGKAIVVANCHMAPDEAATDCAEKNLMTELWNNGVRPEDVGTIYFMGGLGDFSNGVSILPGQMHELYFPCGACIGAMDRNTKIVMIPLNDGHLNPVPYDQRTPFQNLPKTMAYEITVRDAFPFPERAISNPYYTLRPAWNFIQTHKEPFDLRHGWDDERTDFLYDMRFIKDPSDILASINSYMMRKFAYYYHTKDSNVECAEIVIMRCDNGRYYEESNLVKPLVSSARPAADLCTGHAHSVAPDAKVTDIFYMSCNYKQMAALFTGSAEDAPPTISVKNLDPNGAMRTQKMSIVTEGPQSVDIFGRGLKFRNPTVHNMRLNHPEWFCREDVDSRQMSEINRAPYRNPKTLELEKATGIRMGVTL